MSKVKNIFILGDGANWIKVGTFEMSDKDRKVVFALDKFHLMQAINRMTIDKLYKEILVHYVIKNMQSDYKQIIEIMKKDLPTRVDAITKQNEYILNNGSFIQNMYKKVKIGCAMEQAISHVIASVFTSVPKAYSRQKIRTYLNARMYHENGLDLRMNYLTALSLKKDDNDEVVIKEKINLDLFENDVNEPYHLNFRKTEKVTFII